MASSIVCSGSVGFLLGPLPEFGSASTTHALGRRFYGTNFTSFVSSSLLPYNSNEGRMT